MTEPFQTDPMSYTNTWLAEMGYATWLLVMKRHNTPELFRTIPQTLEDCRPDVQAAWLAAAAAIRRRVVNWRLPAEETDPDGADAP